MEQGTVSTAFEAQGCRSGPDSAPARQRAEDTVLALEPTQSGTLKSSGYSELRPPHLSEGQVANSHLLEDLRLREGLDLRPDLDLLAGLALVLLLVELAVEVRIDTMRNASLAPTRCSRTLYRRDATNTRKSRSESKLPLPSCTNHGTCRFDTKPTMVSALHAAK